MNTLHNSSPGTRFAPGDTLGSAQVGANQHIGVTSVLAGSVAGARDQAKPDFSLIVTSEMAVFRSQLASRIGHSLELTDNAKAALAMLERGGVVRLLADFTQLADGWSGMRLLRHVRSLAACTHTEVWLMAKTSPELEAWVIDAGATGIVRRSARAVLTLLDQADGSPAGSKTSFDAELSWVEMAFRSYAGPFGYLHIESARAAVCGGQIEPTVQGLTAFLAECFVLTERRVGFVATVNRNLELASRL